VRRDVGRDPTGRADPDRKTRGGHRRHAARMPQPDKEHVRSGSGEAKLPAAKPRRRARRVTRNRDSRSWAKGRVSDGPHWLTLLPWGTTGEQ
jgi:hypothetical protein